MRLKNYTTEEIRENMDNLVELALTFRGGFVVNKPNIVKVTEKTFKTERNTIRFNDIGFFSYRSGYFLKQDIEFVVEIYKQQSIDKLERTISNAKKEIETFKNLKLQD